MSQLTSLIKDHCNYLLIPNDLEKEVCILQGDNPEIFTK